MAAFLGAWSLAFGLALSVVACAPRDVSGLRERAQQAWSEVLGEVMAAHDEVVAIRNADGFLAEPERFRHYEEAQQRLSVALERLYATIKRYPELTGDTALSNRLREFQRLEDQLVVARSDLIGAVRAHNDELGRFPGGWVAAIVDPKAKPLIAFAQAGMDQPPVPARP